MIESLAQGTLWPWFSFGTTFAPSTLGRDEPAISLGSVPPKDKAMTELGYHSFFWNYSHSPFVCVSPALVGNVCGFNEQNYILNVWLRVRVGCPESPLRRPFGWMQIWKNEKEQAQFAKSRSGPGRPHSPCENTSSVSSFCNDGVNTHVFFSMHDVYQVCLDTKAKEVSS